MSTAICAALRFYKGAVTLEGIRDMTPDQFNIILEEIPNIAKLESGESTPTPPRDMIAAIKNDPYIRKK